MPSLRAIQGIHCSNSRSISVSTVQWQQKPGPRSMLRQPLLHQSLAVQTKEADNLLLDHRELEPDYAYNLERAKQQHGGLQHEGKKETRASGASRASRAVRSVEERELKRRSSGFDHASMTAPTDLIGLTDQELMLSIPITPMKSRRPQQQHHQHHQQQRQRQTPRYNHRSGGGDYSALDPYGISPVELQGLDTEQLRQLVLTLQKTAPNYGGGGSPQQGGFKTHSKSGMKNGLRVNAGASPIVQEQRNLMNKERTLMEQQKRFLFRDLPSDELTPIQEAQRRAWNGYHGGRLRNSKKKNLQLGASLFYFLVFFFFFSLLLLFFFFFFFLFNLCNHAMSLTLFV
jgi:hypothetical protein